MPLSTDDIFRLRDDARNNEVTKLIKEVESVNYNLDLFEKQIKSMKRQRMDIIMRLIELDCTYGLISEVLDISRQRVSQMVLDHRRVLKREDDIALRKTIDDAMAAREANRTNSLEQPESD